MHVLPRHLAIIMDGNGRWAVQQGLSRSAGHRAGMDALKEVVVHCAERGIEFLTVFAFSSENWSRGEQEISGLMRLFSWGIEHHIQPLHDENVKIDVIGELSRFPVHLQKKVEKIVKLTKNNTGLRLIIALNYGGRWDVVEACKKLALSVAQGALSVHDIDEGQVERMLSTTGVPEPDLLIRTSGEQRLSNFLCWQLAYAELYFCSCYWPDFTKEQLDEALLSYSQRERRYGDIALKGTVA